MIMLPLLLAVIDDRDDQEKFIQLYESYEKKVLDIAFGITKDYHDAEEAAQSAFFVLAKNIAKIDPGDEQRTKIYVYKCVKSASYDILRKRNREPFTVNLDAFFDLTTGESVEDELERDEELKMLVKIIRSMPQTYRDVLTYRYLGDFSIDEIAEMVKRPRSTVKSLLYRGSRLLKKSIKEAAILGK